MNTRSEMVSESNGEMAAVAGKYLTFCLDKETYGLEILNVQEIIGMLDVTPVPRAPSYVRGVINLRGKVIPVIDLRAKFDMARHEATARTCIVVMQVQRGADEIVTGIIVDEVSEVLDVAEGELERAPEFSSDVDTSFIRGIGKVDSRVIMLLDMDKVLAKDMVHLSDVSDV